MSIETFRFLRTLARHQGIETIGEFTEFVNKYKHKSIVAKESLKDKQNG
jgi:hypothetical protein